MSVFGGPAFDNDGRILPDLQAHKVNRPAAAPAPVPPQLRPGAITADTYDRMPQEFQRNYSQVRGDDGSLQWLSRFSLLNDPRSRPADNGPRKATEAEFAKMGDAERINYSRGFDQTQFQGTR